MGANTYTPAQWREYNRRTGDRHVNDRLRPVPSWAVLREDLVQQRALFKLSRCRDDDPDIYKRREMTWVRLTLGPTYEMTGDDDDELE